MELKYQTLLGKSFNLWVFVESAHLCKICFTKAIFSWFKRCVYSQARCKFSTDTKTWIFSVCLKRRRGGRNKERVLWTLIQLHWSFLLLSDLLCHRNIQHAKGFSNKYLLDTFNRFVASVLVPTISSYLNGAHKGCLAVCCIEYSRLTNRRQ